MADSRDSGIRSSVSSASERIQEVIDTAERVAGEIQAEARVEARHYAEERRRETDREAEERTAKLSELSDTMVQRVENVRRLADDLAAEISETISAVRGERGDIPASPPAESEPPAAPEAPEPRLQAAPQPPGPIPVAYPGKGTDAPAGDAAGQPPEDALLRATQLAVSGSSREEIEEILRTEYQLEDPSSVTDEILGEAGTA